MEDWLAYCLKKDGAYLDFPFGESDACVKLNGKIFADFFVQNGKNKVTLKCEPALALALRAKYGATVVRGYHCPPRQAVYRNTVIIGEVAENVLKQMIDHSYARVILSLKKAEREYFFAKLAEKTEAEKTEEDIG